MTRVAAIDIGTNSVLLLIADVTPGQEPMRVFERATITRLGEGVDRTRQLAPDACERTLRCLSEYAKDIEAHAVATVHVVGTSAMRDARGGESFVAAAKGLLGVAPRVIAGQEEARLTYHGALSGLPIQGPLVVFDVGGGSTEIIVGRARAEGPQVTAATSLDVGSVRLHERHLVDGPVDDGKLRALQRDTRAALDAAPAPLPASQLVGVAGTVTTLAAMDVGLEEYDSRVIHGYRLGVRTVEELAVRLARTPLTERRKIPGLSPKRADVIVAGAFIVLEVMRWIRADSLVVSDRGVRWGLVRG